LKVFIAIQLEGDGWFYPLGVLLVKEHVPTGEFVRVIEVEIHL